MQDFLVRLPYQAKSTGGANPGSIVCWAGVPCFDLTVAEAPGDDA